MDLQEGRHSPRKGELTDLLTDKEVTHRPAFRWAKIKQALVSVKAVVMPHGGRVWSAENV